MICRKTMQECKTPNMCAPFEGCAAHGSSSTDIVERLRETPLPSLGRISRDRRDAANEIEHLRLEHQHACQEIGVAIAERDEARAVAQAAPDCGIAVDPEDLADMLESWADAANYKGDYLREKHGDTESIAAYRAKYFAASTVPSTDRCTCRPLTRYAGGEHDAECALSKLRGSK